MDKYEDTDDEIDLLELISIFKKKRGFYIRLTCLFFVLGLLVAFVLFPGMKAAEKPSCVLTFLYDGAGKKLAPDGTRLDISLIKSPLVIKNALEKVELSENIPVESVANAVSIKNVLTEATRQKLEIASKVIKADSKLVSDLNEIDLEYENQYIISITNNFKVGNKKIKLKIKELKELLNSIMQSYESFFFDTYENIGYPANVVSLVDLDRFVYLENMNIIDDAMMKLDGYINKMANHYPDYRDPVTGRDFISLHEEIYVFRKAEYDLLFSHVYYNHIAKDSDSLLLKYQYQLKNSMLALDEINGKINDSYKTIETYVNGSILIATQAVTEGSAINTAEINSAYYNKLISDLADLEKDKANIEKRIDMLNDIIAAISSSGKSEIDSETESDLRVLAASVTALYDQICDHIKIFIASDTYRHGNMEFTEAQYVEEEGMLSKLKIFWVSSGIGLILGLILWFGASFIAVLRKENK